MSVIVSEEGRLLFLAGDTSYTEGLMLEQAVDGVSLRERIFCPANPGASLALRGDGSDRVPAEPRPSLRGQTGRPGTCKDRSKGVRGGAQCLNLRTPFASTVP
jgi:hypothetical protein